VELQDDPKAAESKKLADHSYIGKKKERKKVVRPAIEQNGPNKC
jgi:hypothetical protein